MDRVKFGRALGRGARGAAKSLKEAAEAAAAPDPSPKTTTQAPSPPSAQTAAKPPAPSQPTALSETATLSQPMDLRQAAGRVIEAHRLVTDSKRRMRDAAIGAAKESGKGMLAPVKKFSSVLWLQVTGTFFAVITLFLVQGVWRQYGAMHGDWNSPDGHKFLVYSLICSFFLYFTASSFIRASRRGRR